MNNESSASNKIFRQLNHNTSQVAHDMEHSTHILQSKRVIKVRNSHRLAALHIEEKIPQVKEDKLVTQNKQNQPYFNIPSKEVSHSHLHTLPDEKHTHTKIKNFAGSQKYAYSQTSKKRSVVLLENIFQRQPYVKRLMKYLPHGTYCLGNIFREDNIFSTDVKMMIKGEQMIKAKKLGGCLSSEYEIVSENQRSNIMGFVRSNLSGSIFNIYEQNDLQEQKLVSTIWYEDSFSFKSEPRSVQMYILHPEESVDDLVFTGQIENLKQLYERGYERRITKLKNKAPEWGGKGYCMDFGVDHVLPSIKNVILETETGNALIGFYKIKPDEFEIIVRQNVSAFLAYCLALSSLTFKLACQ